MALNLKQLPPQEESLPEIEERRPAPSSLTGNSRRDIQLRLLDVLFVLIISIFMCLYKTGDSSFSSGDQTTHTAVVQQMLKTGNYLHPRYNNRPYYNKPPFKMWLATIPVRFLGETNFAYRVIDGLSGIGIGLCVFLFARSLFLSRLVAYFSLSALFGARLLFFGHGIRNAVQDSMMLFLMTIGTICGWYFIESARSANALSTDERRKRWALALSGGVAIGLAALTKNVAGYFALIILAGYLIGSRELWLVLKRTWGQFLTISALSLGIPAAYILVQGRYMKLAWEMLLVHEVFKRATEGYHFVSHHWIYWNTIVHSRLAVPPELLAIGLLSCVYLGFKKSDRRYLFLLSWALLPVLIQNAMKSKLIWYILPALPGMAIVVGALLGTTVLKIRDSFIERARGGVVPTGPLAAQCALVVFGVAALGYNNYSIGYDILYLFKRNPTDEMLEDIRAYTKQTGAPVNALLFNSPVLAKHEVFYWNQVPQQSIDSKDMDALAKKIDSGEAQFVLANISDFDDVARLRPMQSYSLVPFHDKRRSWLAVISYVPGFLPRHFVPATQTLEFAEHPEILNNGFKSHQHIANVHMSPSRGARSSLLLTKSLPYGILGTDVSLQLASTLPTKLGKIDIHVYLNEEKVATITDVEEGFHRRTFHVPPAAWRPRTNLMTLIYELPDGGDIDPDSQLVLYQSLEIALSQ
ncbi:MAG: phospholipid carrier-dependent glycosyltransferase [Bdellovibrionota bacterium]